MNFSALVFWWLKKYGGEKIIETEKKPEQQIKEIKDQYRKIFINDSSLTLPCKTIGLSFNPNNIVIPDDYGKVFETIMVKSDWGVLNATKAALVWKDWTKVIVSKPISVEKSVLKGDGWEIKLNDGWKVSEIERDMGCFELTYQ